MRVLVTFPLRLYRKLLSPLFGQRCRYYPSCSAYALESVETHGVVKGGWLGLRRLGRCHPWTPGGVDVVPTPETYRWWGIADGSDGESPPPDAVNHDRTTPPNPALRGA